MPIRPGQAKGPYLGKNGPGAMTGNETFITVNTQPTLPQSRRLVIADGLQDHDKGPLVALAVRNGSPVIDDCFNFFNSDFWNTTDFPSSGYWTWDNINRKYDCSTTAVPYNQLRTGIKGDFDYIIRVGLADIANTDTFAFIVQSTISTGIAEFHYQGDSNVLVGGVFGSSTSTFVTSEILWLRIRLFDNVISVYYAESTAPQGDQETPEWILLETNQCNTTDNFEAAECQISPIADAYLDVVRLYESRFLNDTFLELLDTPSTYALSSLKYVRVNAGMTALEFATFPTIPGTFLDLSDTPASYAGSALYYVRVNAGGTALEFAAFPTIPTTFLALSDTPASYAGAGGYFVKVNAGATALEFVSVTVPTQFIQLTDTPGNYTGEVGGRTVRVNSGKTALEYVRAGVSFPFTLTDAATIAVDLAKGDLFRVTLTASRILGNPTNAVDGQKFIVEVKQPVGGACALTFDTKYRFSTDLPQPTLTATASKMARYGFIYHSSDDKFDLISFLQEY